MQNFQYKTYQLDVFWDEEYKTLDYINEPYNDPTDVAIWMSQGYQPKICGELCDMRHRLPSWNDKFIEIFVSKGWHDIGLSYYKMKTGTVMPVHQDRYKRYVNIFDLNGREHLIRRALIMLEDWKSGHYLEVMDKAFVGWAAGQTVEWIYDTPHMAANIGLEDRYTLQITGHL